jgi:ribosome-binding factor A
VSRRTERIASVIRRVVAEALQRRLSDPRLDELASITRVEITSDLSLARVSVSVMSDNPAQRLLYVKALQSSAGRIRGMLAESLTTRTVPQLEFRLDDSLRRGLETLAILDRIRAESGGDPLLGGGSEGDEADGEDS